MQPISHSIPGAQKRLQFGSRQTIYNEINAGRLRSYTVGRRRFISEEACIEYVRAREAEERAEQLLRESPERQSQNAEAAQPSG